MQHDEEVENETDEGQDEPGGSAPGKGATVSECSPGMTGKQRRHLRALGHSLSAVVMVGQHGFTEALAAQLDVQLKAHELIKVRVQEGSPASPIEAARWIFERTGAAIPQILGRTLLAYRRDPESPRIRLPDAAR
jgi:RNA-binding protein